MHVRRQRDALVAARTGTYAADEGGHKIAPGASERSETEMPKVQGTVLSIAETGNAVTDITADQLRSAPRNEQTAIRCDEHETRGLFSVDHQEPPCTFLALLNAQGQLELSVVGDSTRDMLGLRPGVDVEVEW